MEELDKLVGVRSRPGLQRGVCPCWRAEQAPQDGPHRLHDESKVGEQRPVLNVAQIVVGLVLGGALLAQAVYLRQPGHPRLADKALTLPIRVALDALL